ncbi:MAG: hypothetical protein JRM88_06980 [Nitrososphaerota archaeon]|nr:hypothetical protein [Nitrososphaerota archaeon]
MDEEEPHVDAGSKGETELPAPETANAMIPMYSPAVEVDELTVNELIEPVEYAT